ncbi:MAG: DUF6969 family protein [Halothiobacillus sp.]
MSLAPKDAVPGYRDWLQGLSDDAFDEVLASADEFFAINRALVNDQQTILSELLRDASEASLSRWQHYPADDAADPESGAMFYYHAHDAGERPDGEHGHFHLFIRPGPGAEFSHFVALSMDAQGGIRSIFTTNRWVTDEQFRPAQALIDLLPDAFVIDRARPSWLVSRWLMMVTRLIQPQISRVLLARDHALTWSGVHALDEQSGEDRARHVLSEEPVDILGVLSVIQSVGQKRYQV